MSAPRATAALPPVKLHVGCGFDPLPGWINIDRYGTEGVNLAVDVEHEPLPFADGSVNAVFASHVLEHLAHIEVFMNEAHRVLRDGGLFEAYVPYGDDGWFNHVRTFRPSTVRGVTISQEADAVSPRWRLVLCEVSARSPPLAWHLGRYLGIRRSWRWGLPREIHFVFAKTTGAPT